jgi:pSer/pThr/pTyr-binding forkhead associated (FHA) protein
MKKAPYLIIQLVHMQGPLKGEIQEFAGEGISIGRHPSCDVQFPADLDILSRKHAQIVREGNRFKLIDQSTNGTFLNGKPVKEAFLKDGDILLFADGGPKVSFLTKIGEPPVEAPQAAVPPVERTETPQPEVYQPDPDQSRQPRAPQPADYQPRPPAAPISPPPQADIRVERVQMPLIIQYGPTLRTFKELPVTIGRNPACDFSIDHPGLLDHHAQFLFSQEQYWIKDLTGKNLVAIDGAPVNIQAALRPESRIALSPDGPNFRFLGSGRLAEIEEPPLQATDIPPQVPDTPSAPSPDEKPNSTSKTAKKFIGKFFKP